MTAFVAASPARPLLGLAFCIAVYATNLLPYIAVTRCAFIYHYMPVRAFERVPPTCHSQSMLSQPSVHHDRCPLVFLTALHTHVCAACRCTRP
jgi:dolichyl-phosphate-mannose--protein O-mannosyl transferase